MDEPRFLYRVTFLHLRHSTERIVRLSVPAPERVGEHIARRRAKECLPPDEVHLYALLSVVCEGLDNDREEAIGAD